MKVTYIIEGIVQIKAVVW